MQNKESNAAKSLHGYSLNHKLNQLMSTLLAQKKIKNFTPEPRYKYPSKKEKQFSPDGEITLLDESVIVYDNTTSIRHDRLKQKLWDAYGTKEYFKSQNIQIKYYVIIPNNMNDQEIKNALREQEKLNNPEYYSTIDDIITIVELQKIIERAYFCTLHFKLCFKNLRNWEFPLVAFIYLQKWDATNN